MTRFMTVMGFVCALAGSSAHAATLEVKRASSEIRVDARLDEPAWQEASPIAIAYEWYPADDAPAPVATDVRVTYDDRNLYVAFRADDPEPRRIRARYHQRDSGRSDDLVGFYIDPFNDDRRAYQFRINPLGVQIDAINSDVEATEDFSWDGIWESAGRLTDDGYVVEVAVPLQQLRIPAAGGAQTWGFMAIREWPRNVVHRLRSVPTDQDRNCLICQFGDVAGFETRARGRNLEVTPTLTGRAAEQRTPGGGFDRRDSEIDPGVSARWAITPGTSLQATLNPDFSQVEADAAQLDVNNRFALFFPERRPFFVEGADFFSTSLPLVFTRTIADPSSGLKLTGKSGAHSYGALVARDEITNLLLPGDESSVLTSIGGRSTNALARYRLELGTSTTIGALLAAREGDAYENSVFSADAFHRLTESDSVRLQISGSRTAYPDALALRFGQPRGSFGGHSLLAAYGHNDRNWSWAAEYVDVSPDFRADSGFMNQVGIRGAEVGATRRIRGGPERWFRNIFLTASVDARQQYDGDWNEWGSDLVLRYQGPRQSTVVLLVAPNQEYFRGTTYQNLRYSVSGSFQPSRDVTLGLSVRGGESIDFTNARGAEFITISPSAALNLGRRFTGTLAYDYQQFETPDGARIFAVHLPQARLFYHFTDRAFVRTILQYRDLARDPALYRRTVERNSRDLLTQLLFSYRIDAQTVFLAGYSDNYAGQVDLTQTNRTVFAKVSYAFLF